MRWLKVLLLTVLLLFLQLSTVGGIGSWPVRGQEVAEPEVVEPEAVAQEDYERGGGAAIEGSTFNSLIFSEDGEFEVDGATVNAIGRDPSRSWRSGESAGDIFRLGDFQEEDFNLGEFSLNDIERLGSIDLDAVTVEDFKLFARQTLEEMVENTPAIGDLTVGDVVFVYDAVSQLVDDPSSIDSRTISEVARRTGIGDIPLAEIEGLVLSDYSLNDLPEEVQSTELNKYQGWQNETIASVPGLGDISFADLAYYWGKYYGMIATHDVTYGPKEHTVTPTKYAITGSFEEGFRVNCAQERGCAYLELVAPISVYAGPVKMDLHGAQWISGGRGEGQQMVRGGYGILGAVGGFQEPTGRHFFDFNKAFKVVLINTNESEGTGTFGLYFRYCYHGPPIDLGCTPYIIGPVPVYTSKEKDIVLVGLADSIPAPVNWTLELPETPEEIQQVIVDYTDFNDDGVPDTTQPATKCVQRVLDTLPEGERADAAKAVPELFKYAKIISAKAERPEVLGQWQLAYILASVQHESHWKPRDEENVGCGTYGPDCFYGRGLIQITHEENYRRMAQHIKVDIVRQPTLANRLDVAARIAVEGLWHGLFTGYRLWDFMGKTSEGKRYKDYAAARQIVNDHDDAAVVAARAKVFEGALGACRYDSYASTVEGTGTSTGKMIDPLTGQNYTITSEFGQRWGRLHAGIDQGAVIGTPVHASDGGSVVFAGPGGGNFGRWIVLDHQGKQTVYGHVSREDVRPGQFVSQGQVIGATGNEGESTGPHLHFEVRIGGTPTTLAPKPNAQNPRIHVDFERG